LNVVTRKTNSVALGPARTAVSWMYPAPATPQRSCPPFVALTVIADFGPDRSGISSTLHFQGQDPAAFAITMGDENRRFDPRLRGRACRRWETTLTEALFLRHLKPSPQSPRRLSGAFFAVLGDRYWEWGSSEVRHAVDCGLTSSSVSTSRRIGRGCVQRLSPNRSKLFIDVAAVFGSCRKQSPQSCVVQSPLPAYRPRQPSRTLHRLSMPYQFETSLNGFLGCVRVFGCGWVWGWYRKHVLSYFYIEPFLERLYPAPTPFVRAPVVYPGRAGPSDDRRCRPDHLSALAMYTHIQPRQQQTNAPARASRGPRAKLQKGAGVADVAACDVTMHAACGKDNTGRVNPAAIGFHLARRRDHALHRMASSPFCPFENQPARPRSALEVHSGKALANPTVFPRLEIRFACGTRFFAKRLGSGSVGHGLFNSYGPAGFRVSRSCRRFAASVCRRAAFVLAKSSATHRRGCQPVSAQPTTCRARRAYRPCRGAGTNVGRRLPQCL